MMRLIISSSLRFRYLVLALGAVLIWFGVARLRDVPVDVFPEFAPPKVEIQTICLGLSSAEVNPSYLESKRRRRTDLRVPFKYRLSRRLHDTVFARDAPLHPAGRAFYEGVEKAPRPVEKVAHALNDDRKPVNGSKVLVLGVAYKRDIDDVRESPALDVIRLLEEQGATVHFHDPYIDCVREEGHVREGVDLTPERLAAADAVVVVTPHAVFDLDMVVANARYILDTRRAMPAAPNVERL